MVGPQGDSTWKRLMCAEFNEEQRVVFCVFSGDGVHKLRSHLAKDPTAYGPNDDVSMYDDGPDSDDVTARDLPPAPATAPPFPTARSSQPTSFPSLIAPPPRPHQQMLPQAGYATDGPSPWPAHLHHLAPGGYPMNPAPYSSEFAPSPSAPYSSQQHLAMHPHPGPSGFTPQAPAAYFPLHPQSPDAERMNDALQAQQRLDAFRSRQVQQIQQQAQAAQRQQQQQQAQQPPPPPPPHHAVPEGYEE